MILTLWVKRQMLDNDSWREGERGRDRRPRRPQRALDLLVNQLYDNVDVAAAIENRLPEQVRRRIAPTLAGALRQPATNAVNQLLARPRVSSSSSSTRARSRTRSSSTCSRTRPGTGSRPATASSRSTCTSSSPSSASSSACPDETLAKLPADAGVITLMRSDQLGGRPEGREADPRPQRLLLIVVLVLYALAIYLARGHRRETLRNVGWAFVIVGLLVLLVRRFVGNYAVDALTHPRDEKPVRDVWLIGSSILHQIGIADGRLRTDRGAGAVLAGPTRWATSARRHIAPTLNERQAHRLERARRPRSCCSPSGARRTRCGRGGASSSSPASSPPGWSRFAARRCASSRPSATDRRHRRDRGRPAARDRRPRPRGLTPLPVAANAK